MARAGTATVRTIAAAIALMASPGCVAGGSPAIIFEGAPYRLVTGNHLRAAFVGNKIRYPDPYRMGELVLVSAMRCDGFYPDGRYVSCGDRVPRVTGTFEVLEDRVCVTVSSQSRCYQLYRNAAGLYLLGHPGERLAFEPISFVPAADETVAPHMFWPT